MKLNLKRIKEKIKKHGAVIFLLFISYTGVIIFASLYFLKKPNPNYHNSNTNHFFAQQVLIEDQNLKPQKWINFTYSVIIDKSVIDLSEVINNSLVFQLGWQDKIYLKNVCCLTTDGTSQWPLPSTLKNGKWNVFLNNKIIKKGLSQVQIRSNDQIKIKFQG